MISDDELAAIRERFRELDALNDAENPDDDRDRFDKALRVRAWTCAWDVEPLLAEVDRLRGHSITLNAIGFKLSEALGRVPDGAGAVLGNPSRDVGDLIEERNRLSMVVAANHDGAEYAEELLTKQCTEIDRLRARVAELEAQRDEVLAIFDANAASDALSAWVQKEIRAVYSEPAPAEPTADQQARDEADLADINRRVAAEQNVFEKVKAWRAALPWQTGVPRDKYTRRLADTQDALCTAVDALPAEREGGA